MGIEAFVLRAKAAIQKLDGSKKQITALQTANVRKDGEIQGHVVALVQSQDLVDDLRAQLVGLLETVEKQQTISRNQEFSLANIEGFAQAQMRRIGELVAKDIELSKLLESVLDAQQSVVVDAYAQQKSYASQLPGPSGNPFGPANPPSPPRQTYPTAPPSYNDAQFLPAPTGPLQFGNPQQPVQLQFGNAQPAAGVYIVQQQAPQPAYVPSWQSPAPVAAPYVDPLADKADRYKAAQAARAAQKLADEDAQRRKYQLEQVNLGQSVQANLYAKQIQIDTLKSKFIAIMSEGYKKALGWALDINTAKQHLIDNPVPDQKLQRDLLAVFPEWPSYEYAYRQWRWTDEGKDLGGRVASMAGDVYEELEKVGVMGFSFTPTDFAKISPTLQDPVLNADLWTPEDKLTKRTKKTITSNGTTYTFSVGGDRVTQIWQFGEILEEQERIDPTLGKLSNLLKHPPSDPKLYR